jgi:hypothetical protein
MVIPKRIIGNSITIVVLTVTDLIFRIGSPTDPLPIQFIIRKTTPEPQTIAFDLCRTTGWIRRLLGQIIDRHTGILVIGQSITIIIDTVTHFGLRRRGLAVSKLGQRFILLTNLNAKTSAIFIGEKAT